MKRSINSLTALAFAAGLALASSPAAAGWLNKANSNPVRDDSIHPPEGYTSQWWVHPSGCEYSRAGRPGEIVWYVIVNSIGRNKCPVMIVQKSLPGGYDTSG